MLSTNDTIAAVSSATGAASRSIVRLSGTDAISLADSVFSEPLDELAGFSSIGGTVAVNAPYPVSVPAMAYLFRRPRSYTRQDVVELHVPGEVVAAMICSALIDAGARQAEAGEFTARAFFSGRLDLASAEAVADVIDSAADAQLRSAVGVLDGALARLCRPAAETLTEALALTEAAIDFADEDLAPTSADELAAMVRKVADDLDGVLATSGRWSAAGSEASVAIAGRPNVGKSSLLNAISGIDRAIISALAGTTRDVLTAPASLAENEVSKRDSSRLEPHLRVMLMDAAGLEALAEDPDPLTRATHSAARQAVASAEAVLFVIDASAGDHDADERLLAEIIELNRRTPLLILANKIDLVDCKRPIAGDSFSESCVSNVRQARPEGPKDVGRGRKPPVGMPLITKPRRGERALFTEGSVAPPGLIGPGAMSGGLRPRLNSIAPSGLTGTLRRLLAMTSLDGSPGGGFGKDIFPVSALTGEGLDDLRKALAERLGFSASPQAGGLMLHDRQRRAIASAADAACRSAELFASATEVADTAELAAVELRAALAALGELTGQVADEDILSAIFSRFCVGK